MIRRAQPDGSLLVISQPAHAWLSGQLAEQWGAAAFPLPEPRAALVLAAHHHDDGWGGWENAPRLRPDGAPRAFTEMLIDEHLALWRRGIAETYALNPYAAVLAALHAAALYRKRLAGRAEGPEVQGPIRAFLAETEAQVLAWCAGLRDHPLYGPHLPVGTAPADHAPLRLLQVWDLLSLLFCAGLTEPREVEEVPSAEGPRTIEIAPLDGAGERFTLDPWPFARTEFTLAIDGRRLPRASFADEAECHAALRAAPWIPLRFTFQRQRG